MFDDNPQVGGGNFDELDALGTTQELPQKKRRVHYIDTLPGSIVIGKCGWLVPVDHPNLSLNGLWSHTSPIQSISADGAVIETLNTIYTPKV